MQQFIKFKTFNQEEEFINFIDLLTTRRIAYQTEIFNSTIDSASLRPLEKEFIVKVRQMDFSQVNQILDEIAAESVKEADIDHYLFTFSDKELYEIMAKPDEWSAFDYQLAKKILRERGKSIDDDFLQSLKKQELKT